MPGPRDAAAGSDVGTDAFLALHYERSGRRAEAFAAASRGAATASAISSHTEARELYDCAIRTAPPDLPPGDRARLLEGLGASAAATDDNLAASEAYRSRSGQPSRGRRASCCGGCRRTARRRPPPPRRRARGQGRCAQGGAELSIGASPAIHQAPADPAADRVRAKLLAGLAAAYMLDRRLAESIVVRRRGPAAGGPGRGRRDGTERCSHARCLPGLRRTDGRGLGDARGGDR